MVVASSLVIVLSFSFLFLYRAEGLSKGLSQDEDKPAVAYHQDDTYYRTLNAEFLSEHGSRHLNPGLFFYVIAVNPIPRFFWGNKPALLDDYFGEYKRYYFMISFLGELVALFGIAGGTVIAIAFSVFFYHIIEWSARQKFITWPLGIGVYMMLALYAYRCMRSLLNLTVSIYLVIGIIAFSYAMHRLNVSVSRRNNDGRLKSGRFTPALTGALPGRYYGVPTKRGRAV